MSSYYGNSLHQLSSLKIIFSIGLFLTTFASLLMVIMLGVKYIINAELISYNAILTVGLLFVTGVLTIFQGVIALYLVDIFNATKGRPTYIVQNEANADEKSV